MKNTKQENLYSRIAIIALALNFALNAYVIYTLNLAQQTSNDAMQEHLALIHSLAVDSRVKTSK